MNVESLGNPLQHKDVTRSKGAFTLAIAATSGIFLLDLAGGFWTHSLALLSDAAHTLLDLLSFVLSFTAILLAQKPASDNLTYGWHRLEVFAALINALSVFLTAILIFVQAFKRLASPEPILVTQMLAIASFSLAVNLWVVLKLRPHTGKDLNVHSAFLHALGDALASVAVIVGGLLVQWTGKLVMDPVAAIAVGFLILANGWTILRDSTQILLEGVPRNLKRELILSSIEELSGRETVKDLHVWCLCSHICSLSLHLQLPEDLMGRQESIRDAVQAILEKKFGILHTTIQIQSENREIQDLKKEEYEHA